MDLEDALKAINPNICFDYHCLYPCAWIALRKAGRSVQFVLPMPNLMGPHIDCEEAEKAVDYHTAILGAGMRQELEALYQRYLSYFQYHIARERYSGAILVGDSRLTISAAKVVFRSKRLPVLFWEQGPFRTTQLNRDGVNANARVRLPVVAANVAPDRIYADGLPRAFSRTVLSRFGTWLTNVMSSGHWAGRFAPIDRICAPSATKVPIVTPQVQEQPEGTYVYLLQVPFDNQIIEHGGKGRDVTKVLEMLLKYIPSTKLLIRQHPLHREMYPPSFYNMCLAHSVRFADDLPINNILDYAEGVIVANSTAGAEAMERGRKVLILGEAFYACKGLNYSLSGPLTENETLTEYLSAPAYDPNRSVFVRQLVSQNFFRGHYLFNHGFDEALLGRIVRDLGA